MEDQELIAYLDVRFRETSRQIAESREETAQQIASLREDIASLREETAQRFEQVDRRFEQVDRRFEQVDRRFEQVDRRFEQADRRFEGLEETTRQTLVLVEDLRSQVHLLAEGYFGLNERLEHFQSKVALGFDDVKASIKPYYRDLDNRVRILEGRSERLQGDVMEAIRKLLGRPPRESE